MSLSAGDSSAGASRGNYCRSQANRHNTSHSGDNGSTQLDRLYRRHNAVANRLCKKKQKKKCGNKNRLPSTYINTHFNSCSFKHIKTELLLIVPNTAICEKCNAGKLLASPSEGHMIQLSDAKMPMA